MGIPIILIHTNMYLSQRERHAYSFQKAQSSPTLMHVRQASSLLFHGASNYHTRFEVMRGLIKITGIMSMNKRTRMVHAEQDEVKYSMAMYIITIKLSTIRKYIRRHSNHHN